MNDSLPSNAVREFRSRTDFGGIALIWGLPIAIIMGIDVSKSLTIGFLQNPKDMWIFAIFYYPILISCFSFLLMMTRSTKYIIGDKLLTIKAIGMNCQIPIRNIEAIKISYNPISAPATSLRRLLILGKNNKWLCLISPEREKEFIELMLQIKPEIQLSDSLK